MKTPSGWTTLESGWRKGRTLSVIPGVQHVPQHTLAHAVEMRYNWPGGKKVGYAHA